MHNDRIARYTALGALAGLLIGGLEGIHVYRTPVPSAPLKPSVGYVIWFLAPLLDGAAAAFLGLLAGLAAWSSVRWARSRVVKAVEAHLPAVLAFAVSATILMGAEGLMRRSRMLHALVDGLVLLLVLLAVMSLGRYPRLRTLGGALVIGYTLLLAGVALYAIRHSIQPTTVGAKTARRSGKPNIILITLDTVRADHLSVYGYARRTTPNLDRWAKRGVLFENAISASSWTLPSHASILTGLLPHQHGANWHDPFDTNRWTLADALKARGYETAGFTSNLWYGQAGWGMDEGFRSYDDDSRSVRHNIRALFLGDRLLEPLYQRWVRPDSSDRRDAVDLNSDVMYWLQNLPARPFFAFINYFDVHGPYLLPSGRAGRFGDVPLEIIERTRPAVGGGHARVSAQDREALLVAYDDCLAFLDTAVGGLLDSLSRLPGWENTIVIVTSDHGESFGEHGAYSHGLSLYRQELHVPLMMFGSHVPQDRRISNLVETRELFPTVMEFSGADNPLFSRNSLARLWAPGHDPGGSTEFAVSELMPKFRSASLSSSISLTTPEWQYLCDARGDEELYHWVSDPEERANVAKSPENEQILKGLRTRLYASVRASFRPWKRPEYLLAVAQPGESFVSLASTRPELESGPPRLAERIGGVQALFPPKASASIRRQRLEDQDLLRSLPYH